MVQGTWPVELLEDPARRPRYVATAAEFLREILIGNHLEDFVILPNGVELLELSYEDSIPSDLREALAGARSVCDFVSNLRKRPEVVEKYRADIEYVDAKRQQRCVLRKEKHDLGRRIEEVLRMQQEGSADPSLFYVAEMRLRSAAPHPIGGDEAKTVCLRDVKDILGPYVPWTLYWDRYDEGFFAGGRNSGKGVHVDQVLWSNVGRNWKGHKLVAAWPKGEVSKLVATELYDVLFSPPLRDCELEALAKAAKVVLLRPGDVYLFSGGVAHTVLCVSDEMCLGAYESLVTMHPAHVELFLHTDDSSGPFCLDKYSMCCDELRDTKEDCIDHLEDASEQLSRGGPSSRAAREAASRPNAPPGWARLLDALDSDAALQATLREHFAAAVRACASERYFAKHLPRQVLAAADSLSGCAGAGGVKRRRPGSSSRSDPEDLPEGGSRLTFTI